MKVSVSTWAHLSFWLASLAMVGMGYTLYEAAVSEADSSRLLRHTQEVRLALSEINAQNSRAESAQRGYLLSGFESYLAERDEAFEKVNETVAEVGKLTSDSPVQQDRIAQLAGLFATRATEMRASARVDRAGNDGTVQAAPLPAASQGASARIRELVAELRQEELRLMKAHRADANRRQDVEQFVLIGAVIFGIIVLLPGYLGFVMQSRARRRSELMLRVLADSLPGAMYQLKHDPRGLPRFTFLSAGVKNVSNITAAGAAGALPDWDKMVACIDERDRAAFVAALSEATTSLAAFRHTYRVSHGDGTSRCVHHEASLHRERDGSILQNGYVGDVTEQKGLEAALQAAKDAAEAANRAKSAFLATMSHEIRTPMNSALGMLELLSLSELDAEQRDTLEIVRESGRSLLRILDDILDFSKIEAGKLDMCPEPASLRDIIEDVRDLHSGAASGKGLLIRHSVDPRLSPAVLVDPLRLRQILGNFVSNALKFTSEGHIEIKAELIERANGDERVRFSVEDTGIGISAPNQLRLFQPFSQIDGEAARPSGGTGLGLTICRRLAELMGGQVTLASVPDRGTTMTLTLTLPVGDPLQLPQNDRAKARDLLRNTMSMRRAPPAIAYAESEGTLVLLVDDHPTNRALLARQTQALGYASESAEDGVEALEKWKSGRFGIVITDCDMPGMNGYDLARSIRVLEAASGARRTPVIACTANALGGESDTCLAAGMDDLLVKPVDMRGILQILDRWLPIPQETALPSRVSVAALDALAAAAPLDRTVLAAISAGDAATEREILTDFQRINDEDAATLMRAVATSDMRQVIRSTHRMLGASRMVGALGFAGVCERIERASRAGDWQGVAASMASFHQEWTRLNAYSDAI